MEITVFERPEYLMREMESRGFEMQYHEADIGEQDIKVIRWKAPQDSGVRLNDTGELALQIVGRTNERINDLINFTSDLDERVEELSEDIGSRLQSLEYVGIEQLNKAHSWEGDNAHANIDDRQRITERNLDQLTLLVQKLQANVERWEAVVPLEDKQINEPPDAREKSFATFVIDRMKKAEDAFGLINHDYANPDLLGCIQDVRGIAEQYIKTKGGV